jgi:ABC-type bacteriocin/lantibiotic exporter with double-glycine peptidase domain
MKGESSHNSQNKKPELEQFWLAQLRVRRNLMVEVKAAIPKLIVLILGIWLFLPSEIDIGTLILENFLAAYPSRVIETTIFGLRFLGVLLIALGVLFIVKQLREGEYF